jgi:transposase
MPKRAYLAPYFSTEELKDNYRKTKDLVEARRWHFLWKVALGWTVEKSSLAVGISRSYGWKILKSYNEKGLEGVNNEKKKSHEHSRGSKPLLNEEQFRKLTEKIQKRPPDGGIWTGPKVARWIEKETGIERVWNQRGWDYLKKSKYSWQKPRPKHRKGDPIEQENFKNNLSLKIEANYPKNLGPCRKKTNSYSTSSL